MIGRCHLIAIALVVCWAVPARAQPMGPRSPMGPPAFLEHVFPPELIMRHQREIDLSDAQREAITRAMGETQEKLVGLRWQFEAESQELTQVLKQEAVDETAALKQAEKVMTLEEQIKREHLRLLIRIKNQLNAAQQAKLRELEPERRRPRFRR